MFPKILAGISRQVLLPCVHAFMQTMNVLKMYLEPKNKNKTTHLLIEDTCYRGDAHKLSSEDLDKGRIHCCFVIFMPRIKINHLLEGTFTQSCW